MYKVGITGGIATGKSTVANYLKDKGFPVIDCDKLAKKSLELDTAAYKAVITKFGSEITLEDRTIDRKMLGKIVFNNEDRRLELESIVHEQVLRDVQRLLRKYKCKSKELVFIDIPLLYEVKWNFLVDEVWTVYCPKDVQLSRIIERNNLNEEDALSRINAQISIEKKRDLADVVIDSNQSLESMYQQVERELERLKSGFKRV